jgi:hypothetical protein
MYLAKHVGRWSLSQIGKFYNGRHHTTVLHAITKIETFRETDESVDALIEVLTNELAAGPPESPSRFRQSTRSTLVEAVATRVIDRLAELQADNVPKMAERLISFLERATLKHSEAIGITKPRACISSLPTGTALACE